jgi:uncharacterized protein (TIGR00251 family)
MSKTTSSNLSRSRLPFLRQGKEGILLRLNIQPRASKNEIIGIHGETALKIRLTSPPVEGAANSACIEFLANILEIKKSQIEITSGQKSRIKKLKITGISLEEAGSKIFKYLT